MKEKIKKLGESTAAKILAATIIPGGFLMWGAYELGKFVQSKKEQRSECDDTSQPTRDSVQDGHSSEVQSSEPDSDKTIHDKDKQEGELDDEA